MKLAPMPQQVTGAELLAAAPEFYALGCEQGTGKTYMILEDAERQFAEGRIDALLVIAPKGVHANWVRREIPKHLSRRHRAEYWMSGMGMRRTRTVEKLITDPDADAREMKILAMNVDAVNTPKGFAFARRFMKAYRVMMVVDESQRIKTFTSKRSEKVCALGRLAVSRRIASGTLVANTPLDLFGQYHFLRPGLLGTTSYRAFVAEYSELLPADHPMVVEIIRKTRTRGSPQIQRTDRLGRPVYKNLDKLRALIAPHTYRVLKSECLDLPPKIYQNQYFELSPTQRKLYESIKRNRRYDRDDGQVDIYTPLTTINKLRQVSSGFLLVDGENNSPSGLTESKPKMDALREILVDIEGPFIIWASFIEELELIAEMVEELGISLVRYQGSTKEVDREAAVDKFQDGTAQAFIANAAAGGTGLTLTAAETVVYFSCSYSLTDRLQSEDRAHRIGTVRPVRYIDLVAVDTIDEQIALSLQNKEEVSAYLLD